MAAALARLRAAKSAAAATSTAAASTAPPAAAARPAQEVEADAMSVGTQEADQYSEEMLTTIMRLLSVHDRDIAMLLDRVSIVFMIYDETLKTELQTLRDDWRARSPQKTKQEQVQAAKSTAPQQDAPAQDPPPPATVQPLDLDATQPPEASSRPAAAAAAAAPKQGTYTPHPDGSQRSVIFAWLTETLTSLLPTDNATQIICKQLSELSPEQIDESVFRLKSSFDTPAAGKPWFLVLVTAETATPEFLKALRTIGLAREPTLRDKINVTAQHSRDSPLVKRLRSSLQKKKRNS